MSIAFELPAELTIYSALETRDALLAWVTEHAGKSNRMLDISARRVAEIDGSGLQLLAALSSMDVPWQVVEASPVFSEACRVLGLTHWIGHLPLKSET